MSFIEFFLGAFLVYAILRVLIVRRERMSAHVIQTQRISTPERFNKADIIFFKIEEINGIFYLWNKDSEDFLAQGATVEEAFNVMVERFPDKVFRSDSE